MAECNSIQTFEEPNKATICSNVLETCKHLKVNEPNGVLVLPPHYVQLAAALGLGLDAQTIIDPVATRTDFERLIEMNRVQPSLATQLTVAAGKLTPYSAAAIEAAQNATSVFGSIVHKGDTGTVSRPTTALKLISNDVDTLGNIADSISVSSSATIEEPNAIQSSHHLENVVSSVSIKSEEQRISTTASSSSISAANHQFQWQQKTNEALPKQEQQDENMWRPW